MEKKAFDRTTEDLGNIVNLGHVNLNITDQRIATHFYITGLGLTRDPYLNTGVRIMWVNVGMSQFHLPTGEFPNVLRGTMGLVIPDQKALLERLKSVSKHLQDTKFQFSETNDGIDVTCPWGNRLRVHTPEPSRFGRMALGFAYIAFDVPAGTSDVIARFYREVMGTSATVETSGSERKAKVQVGEKQFFYFVESARPPLPYDGHHTQIYICDFSGPYRRLVDLGLLTVEFGQHEYRFQDIIDLDSRQVLYTVEHEVRSQTHPMFARPLVNRNPAQDNRNYKPGHDSMSWALP
jgi:hypothetical protein